MISSIKKLHGVIWLYDLARRVYRKYFIDKMNFARRQYKKALNREMNIDDPVLYNDKLQWLKFNSFDPLAVTCSDKYEVRAYVKEKIGAQYLNTLYGVYSSVAEIDWEKLPNTFVMKGAHSSGDVLICKDKSKLNIREATFELKRWLRKDYYNHTNEWVYKGLEHRIVCEEYLEDSSGQLTDYKIFCFNGEPKIIKVDFARYGDHKKVVYDTDWNRLDVALRFASEGVSAKRPEKLDEMLEISKTLSKDFNHVRVDLYYLKGRIIFGELTFFHGNCTSPIMPLSFEKQMGDWLKLPNM